MIGTVFLVTLPWAGDADRTPMLSMKSTSNVVRVVKENDLIPGLEPKRRYQWAGREIVLFAVRPGSAPVTGFRELELTELMNPPPR